MKKLAVFLVAVLLAIEIAGFAPTEAYAATTGTVNVSALNVRTGASTSHSLIGVIYSGATVSILATSGSWYQISTSINGTTKTGYVYKDYITAASSSSQSGSGSSGVVNVSALNVRSGPSTSNSIMGTIKSGAAVTILETSGQWYKITTTINGVSATGYVYAEYITRTSSGSSDSGSSSGSAATGTTGVVNTGVLNVRSAASISATRIGCIYANQTVTILATQGEWYKIQATVNGTSQTVYAFAAYITVSGSSGSSSSSSDSSSGSTATETTKGTVNDGPLNIRSGASTSHSILGYLAKGSSVDIVATEGAWYKINVTLSGKATTGYVYAQYITISSSSGTDSGSSGSDSSSSTQTGTVNDGPLNIRSAATTSATILGYVATGTKLTILATEGSWYKVQVSISGKSVTGYAYAQYVTLDSSGSGGDTTTTDTDFETQIAAFPESYKAALRSLHAKYPNWVFKAVNTGLDWNTVIANENVYNINMIQVSSIGASTDYSVLSTLSGAYDWSTDKYTMTDAGNFYTVSESVLKYYMDPRNFLDEKNIFMFESLAYDSSQTINVVQGILSGTFMSGSYTDGSTTRNYAETFMEAGKANGVSPYFLAARSRQEVGVNGSGSVSGTYGNYAGYYNYYNIGANSGSDPISNGLQYASGGADKTATSYGRPWNTRYKAIVGGAQFLGASYISVGQNTVYFQKYNVVYKNYLYRHQYMGAVHATTSEASIVYNSYSNLNVLNNAIVFYIPVYNNMPSSACTLPAKSGNPNSYLKSLTVTANGTNRLLTPTFSYDTTTYDLVVESNISQITIGATSVSVYAQGVTGTGTVNLQQGMNTFTVTCTAGNGTTTTYTLRISRQ